MKGRGGWRPAARLVSAWVTPVLLLAVPTSLLGGGREGLWVALLFVVAPLFAILVAAGPLGPASEAAESIFPLVAMLLVVGLMVWANLSLAGDIAAWMGLSRWRGILPVAAATLGLMLWPKASRAWPWLVPVGLLALLLPLSLVLGGSDPSPISTWNQVASQPAFRFPADSPWVTEGRAVDPRGGSLVLVFEEEHRLTPLDPGSLRVEVVDRGQLQVQEWKLAPGQSVTLRPSDRLQVDTPRRLKFEAGKRIPGAPISGIAWADSPLWDRPLALVRLVGLGVTLLGGAVALVGIAGSTPMTRSTAGLAGVVLVILAAWGQCWAIYAARWAPEFFLGGVTAATLLELPVLVLRGTPWGPRLADVTLVGLFVAFLAGSLALREQVAASDRGVGEALRSDLGLWSGLVALAALASLGPAEPWSLMLTALGLGASTRAPLILVGAPRGRPRATGWAVGLGLALFLGLTAAGRLAVSESAAAQAILANPALVAAPFTACFLWVARRVLRP